MTEDEQPETPFKWEAGFAECLAHIANNWAHLEFFLNFSIWLLSGVDALTGACLTSQIQTATGRVLAIKSLLELREAPESLVKRVNKFAEKLRGPTEHRNRSLHDIWLMDRHESGGMARLEITAPGRLRFEPKNYRLEDLERTLDEIIAIRKEANAIRWAISRLPTLPEKHPSLRDPMEGVE